MTDLAGRRGVETSVYRPAEDSRLLARTVAPELAGDDTVLEVGCGSGFVADHLGQASGATVVGADINPHACEATAERGIRVARADLVAPFRDDQFDVVVFNPPYLPADPVACRDDWMEVALTGGPDGRAVVDRFLATVDRVLVPGGQAYILISNLTGVEDVVRTGAEHGFSAVALADESYPFETLTVLKLLASEH